jgi:hypothetical protein
MFNVCDSCGAYRVDKVIDERQSHAICPECGHRHPFIRLPLLLVSGASGSGKSSVCRRLQGALPDAVLFDGDILWAPHFESDPRLFFETWLRVCKNTAQAGKPVVLFGAGMGVPENLESCVERRYFTTLHYLALTCDDTVLAERLRRRPSWRSCGSDAYIEEHVRFNRWFKDAGPKASPPIDLIDTTAETAEQTTARVVAWTRDRLT